ncbi:MAG: hypothetical protein Q9227_003014 [Pyrenula ochraceoflavens]
MAQQNPHHHYQAHESSFQPSASAPVLYPQVIIPKYQSEHRRSDHAQQDGSQRQPRPPKTGDPETIVIQPSSQNEHQELGNARSQSFGVPQSQSVAASSSQIPFRTMDYQTLMLSLIEEYLAAAYRCGSAAACSSREQDIHEYYRLIATALACIESLLQKASDVQQHWRLQPLLEAKLRLRYARLLYEETENLLEAETVLTKGNQFWDLKYAAQILLVRILDRSNHKAAMKAADVMIDDIQTYHHVAWEYALRLLCAGLAFSEASTQNLTFAIQHLQKVTGLAERNGDKIIFVMATTLEAFAYLLVSGADSVSLSQRALAKAQQLQLDPQIDNLPQLRILIMLVDLAGSLRQLDAEQAFKKMGLVHSTIDKVVARSEWAADGTISLPISTNSLNGMVLHAQDVIELRGGTPCLKIHWLPKDDVYALTYLLSGAAAAHRNSMDSRKAEQHVTDSLKVLKSRGSWESAQQSVNEAKSLENEEPNALAQEAKALLVYLRGVIAQGTGQLDEAISIYQRPELSLFRPFNRTLKDHMIREISMMAAFNLILIARDVNHPAHNLVEPLIGTLRPLCQESHSKLVSASFSLIEASLNSDSTLKTKQFFGIALNVAKMICNNQVTCITLSLMSNKFFKGVVGDQAEKSARAGQAVAKKSGNPLWISVTDGMLAETLEKQGKLEEAGRARHEAIRMLHALPPKIRKG